jgi:MFS family permease
MHQCTNMFQCTLQIPGGWAAQLYGGRRTLIASFLAWSLASLLTPGDASSVTLTVLARVCVGLAQGGLIPSVHTVLSKVGMQRGWADDCCWRKCDCI